jgi:hypothetical protein
VAIQVCDLHSYFTDIISRGPPNEKRIHVHENNTHIVDVYPLLLHNQPPNVKLFMSSLLLPFVDVFNGT